MNEKENTSIIIEIESEYGAIDRKWLNLHYTTFIALVLFGFLLECILGILLFQSGYIEIPLRLYVQKYIVLPLLVNSCFLLVGFLTMRSSKPKLQMKSYVISLLCVAVCFVFYSVHIIWLSLYMIFILPILLTVVYTDYGLTTFTAFISFATKISSDLFITWDPDKVYLLQSTLGLINFVISICVMIIFYTACMIVIRFETEKKHASIQKEIDRYHMQQRLTIDELTEIYNRTALRKAFQSMERDSTDNNYYLVMIDLDNFKTLNDTLGHQSGDQCLKEFGSILKKHCVKSTPFRFGGDEFCILTTNSTLEEVIEKCKRIQNDLKESVSNQLGFLLTASIGIAHYKNQMTTTQLLQNTDYALYRSKKSKNSICVYDHLDYFSKEC